MGMDISTQARQAYTDVASHGVRCTIDMGLESSSPTLRIVIATMDFCDGMPRCLNGQGRSCGQPTIWRSSVDKIALCPKSWHTCTLRALTGAEKRLVISDYFLNEDEFGKVHAEGDHKIHVARVTSSGLSLDPRFELDFNTAFATGPARPHGVAFK